MHRPLLDRARLDAVIFDMDGVITDTASVHEGAWKRLFDTYLRDRAEHTGETFEEFTNADYRRYVDGKPRYDGVRSFLASRGIELDEGELDDPPERETVRGLGNRKNDYFLTTLERDGVEPFDTSVRLLGELREAGFRTAIISASRNAGAVLSAAGVEGRYDIRVDGTDELALGFAGKPAPDVFLVAAERLGVSPERAAVVEDAIAGVQAGRSGGFALVVGVDRTGNPQDLLDGGADVVVSDLGELEVAGGADGGGRTLADLPDALAAPGRVAELLDGRMPAVFLDYDGTLTPIVDDPADATLPAATRAAVEHLIADVPVAVVSGRDLDDVRALVGIDGIHYAGSHGFDIVSPAGDRHVKGVEYLPALDAAEAALAPRLEAIPGAALERKRFAIAVHFRRVDEAAVDTVEQAVRDVAGAYEDLRVTGGKKILELRPDLDWDKGRALELLIEELDLDADTMVPVYVGDDVTDEDAFRALRGRGIGVVVRGEDDDRPTDADLALADTDAARDFLEELHRLVTDAG